MAVKEAQAGLPGVLDVAVSFEKNQAIVRFEIGKVRLDQILKRYASTPFDVSAAGPVTTIVRQDRATVRAWADPAKLVNITSEGQEPPPPAAIFVEFVPAAVHRFAAPPSLSLPQNLSDQNLKLVREVAEISAADAKPPLGPGVLRFGFAVRPEGHIEPGQVPVATEFRYTALDPDGKRHDGEGKVTVVLEATGSDGRSPRTAGSTGVALVGGALELGLGHLCDQQGCVEHLHKSLAALPAVVGVRPRPSLNDPRATLFVEAGQPVDVWGLREKLREQGVEVRQIVPRDLGGVECHIELPRWRGAGDDQQPSQCQKCRERTLAAVQSLAWTSEATLAGAGVTVRTRQVDADLCTPLDKLEAAGVAPRAVWLVPAGVLMPKPATPQPVAASAAPKTLGSEAHPLIQFDLGHVSEACPGITSVLAEQEWASRTGVAGANLGSIDERHVLTGATALATVGDRQRADLLPILRAWQAHGQRPTRIRLANFGDLRVQFEFAHLCGEVEYSKPPKKEETKTDEMKAEEKKSEEKKPSEHEKNPETGVSANARTDSGTAAVAHDQPKDESPKDEKKEAEKKEEKPFVPKPLRPATSSNARQAIERAIASVKWVEEGTYLEYHTKPEFDSPRKLTITMRPAGDGVVRLDELTRALAQAGFPPTAVRVSRLFPGLPFGHALPTDLELETPGGEKRSLASYRKPGRPLAIAFVSLYCPKWDKYKYDAEPKLFAKLKQSIEAFQDRVDFVAVSSNPDDKLVEVAEMLEKAELRIPLLNDPSENARAVFNAQVTPPPHLFIFDGDGRLRYAGDPHSNWNKPGEEQKDFLGPALDAVLASKFAVNGAVSFNSPKCNCSSPNCKCPKCGCGPSCRCDIGH